VVGLLFAALGTAALCLGCAKKCSRLAASQGAEERSGLREAKASTPEGGAQGQGTSKSEPPSPPTGYAAAIRTRAFADAARLIDAAPSEERQRPEVRYARALVALEQGDPSRALAEISSLRSSTPAFQHRADQLTLRIAKQTRDATVLGHLLAQTGDQASAEDRLLLAEVLVESGQVKEAEVRLSGVIRTLELEKSTDVELLARAREARARLRRQLSQSQAAAADFRWLALNAVGEPAAEGADQQAEHLDPQHPLTRSERLARARRLSELGRVENVSEELRRLAQAPGAPPEPQALTFVRGWALYASRTDYEGAAALFQQASLETGSETAKCRYYQAKALARSGQHASAIAIYRQVAKLGGPYVEPASYEAVRLLHLSGDWTSAISGYERYLQRFPKGAHRASVLGDLPVVRLAVGEHDQARRELAALVRQTDDARERARLLELEAVAAAGQKDAKTAVALFRQVIEEQPLTLPALLAQKRLRSLGAPTPPLLPPHDAAYDLPPLPRLRLPDLAARLHRVGLDAEAELALKAEEPALKARYGERAPEVLCRLYGQLESATRRYQVAQTATKRVALFQEPTGDGAWQWECIYPKPYAEVVGHEAKTHGISESFVYAVMRQESAFRPSVVSSAAAVGLMQIIPPTASQIGRELGVPYQPELMTAPPVNIQFGTYYLSKLVSMFGGRPELAAAAYNAGPRALSGWLRSLAVLPADLFLASIPYEETRNYVYRVMSNYARYAYLAGERLPDVALELPQGLVAPADAY